MNNQSSIRKATNRLIDSVWTVSFQIIDGKAHIIRYDRVDEDGYRNERNLPMHRIIEADKRIATHLLLCPYKSFGSCTESNCTERYEIANPQYIFSYSPDNI